ncbi:hypothetical protein [Hydrogenophaga aquatica]
MYGAEHGFLLHTALMIGSWLVFFLVCAAPFALVFLAYRIGIRRGRYLERRQPKNDNVGSDGVTSDT